MSRIEPKHFVSIDAGRAITLIKELDMELNYEFHTMFIDNDTNYNTTLNIDEIINSVSPYLRK